MYAANIKDYWLRYPNAVDFALKDISVTIEEGSFVLLCGPTGSGKSSFLKAMKKEVLPACETKGEITFFGGAKADGINPCDVGYVFQNPDNQIVMDTVFGELAFGLKNMGLTDSVIRRRIGEAVSFFGLENILNKKVYEISGGQKQIVNLASVMVMQPKMLLLDEPLAQLDPVAAKEFIHVLKRINDELGTTVIISEHRLEELLLICDKVFYIEKGRLLRYESPGEFAADIQQNSSFKAALPAFVHMAEKFGEKKELPLSVKQARLWLAKKGIKITPTPFSPQSPKGEQIIAAKNIWFKYGARDNYVLKGLNAEFVKGEIHGVIGGNGSGKSTLLNILAGAVKGYSGKIKKDKRIKTGLVTQNPMAMFSEDTLYKDLCALKDRFSYREDDVCRIMEEFKLWGLKDQSPFDLSGGETQKAALAKLLLTNPDVYLLDEPTKGVDAVSKEFITGKLKRLKEQGKTVILVTHDLEFAAKTADRCLMLLDGLVAAEGESREFFDGNLFYTTALNRITCGTAGGIVTERDILYEQDI